MSLDFFAEFKMFDYEERLICGVDEAGRGPLAGPVVAAAVILNPERPIQGLADSKKLSPKRREQLFDEIQQHALAYQVASSSVQEIDQYNILRASLWAMKRAVEGLSCTPELVLVDGNQRPPISLKTETIVKGDQKIAAISAASILAKVTRDRLLKELHQEFPQYRFDLHSGYPTPFHLAALKQFGACIHHRRSFAPVRAVLV